MKAAARFEEIGDGKSRGASQSRQRDMRRELARFGGEADAAQGALVLGLQFDQRRGGLRVDDDGARPAAAKGADAVQRHPEARPGDGVERVGDIAGRRAVDIADEAQRQMIEIRLQPARARQAAAQRGKFGGERRGDFEACEQTRHRLSPWRGESPCHETLVGTHDGSSVQSRRSTFFSMASTAGRMRSTMRVTPARVGCMPSPCCISLSPATPSRKKG
jgi:hypothetical protein